MAPSNARQIKIPLAVLVLLFPAVAQQLTERPLFRNRSMVGPGQNLHFFAANSPGASASQFDSVLADAYSRIDMDRSLLIHDCTAGGGTGWCQTPDDDPAFAFQQTFSRAGRIAALKPGQASLQWFVSAQAVEGFTDNMGGLWDGASPAGAPFLLLAVVNRIDLAEWDASRAKWKNAELRFVYGLKKTGASSAPPFTLIIEFVLPDLSWSELRALAADWQALAGMADTQLRTSLVGLVAKQFQRNLTLARLRTNWQLSTGHSKWGLAQWEFNTSGLARTDLTDQINSACVNTIGAMAGGCATYPQLWGLLAGIPDLKRWEIPAGSALLSNFEKYAPFPTPGPQPKPLGMATPWGVCNPSPRVRNVLSLQQCTFCHGAETNNDFTHVKNRLPTDRKAALSNFVQGLIEKPTFTQLKTLDPAAVFPVDLTYQTYSGQGSTCSTIVATQPTQHRYFHDLGRRALFLAAILIAPPGEPVPQGYLDLIASYGADFSH
jgi:hypothetical protein